MSCFAIPASAQLSTYVDDHGAVVYTNAESAVPRKAKPAAAVRPSVAPETTPATAPETPPSTAQTPAVPASAGRFLTPLKPAPAELDRVVQKSAEKNHVDPDLVRAVISTESNWNASAVSRKGALGLMQLIPETAQGLGVGNAFDPEQNVDAGTRYLGMLLARYKGDLNKALAAYNAGPGAVDRFGGVPRFRETRDYVQRVTSTYYRPGTDRLPRAVEEPAPIYRATDSEGRIVFTNE